MKANYLVIGLLTIGFISCKKNKDHVPPPPDDIVTVKLKDVVISDLPSPYYHFEYDNRGYISRAEYSSGIRIYDVSYTGRNITKMEDKSAVNRDNLSYEYVNGELAVIKVFNSSGVVYRRCFVTHSASHQLQKLEWEVKDGNVGFAVDHSLEFTYYGDGNLKQLVKHTHALGNRPENTVIDNFENYDNKVNADGFSLLQTEGNHLLLLPKFKLQVNNPRKIIRSGTGVTYVIDNTYTYDAAGRPLTKTGDILFTSGSNNGQRFVSHTAYSYYN